MRVVFDTNIFVSVFIKPSGITALVLAMARQGAFQSLVSSAITDELRGVLLHKLKFERDRIENSITILSEYSANIKPAQTLNIVNDDPTDNRILECAVEGNADAIVSEDRHLLALKSFRGIPIITVREFIRLIHRD